ncbi:MAG: 5'-methylthioadenosine/adenosylhomocysteine nucleosidase [Verrucomicrobia bacterium]|nr:5'-methylthioadenosine/adenosylhomocysteine nucleosidase [Verrucomicrobiota bacterium]
MNFFVILFCGLFLLSGLDAAAVEELLSSHKSLTIGIISAVPGESGRLLELMEETVSTERGRRLYHRGKLKGIDTVLVSSRIGKVASSATATNLIVEYKVDLIIFTGVAGAIDPTLNIGDIVVATALIQHDLNCNPFCPTYEIPLLKLSALKPDPTLELFAFQASQKCAQTDLQKTVPAAILSEYHIAVPKVVKGIVLTGDQVISKESQKQDLKEKLPDALCVEMEGASVGQVCYEYNIPFAVIRTISDYANHQELPIDIKKFVTEVSGYYAESIIKNIYELIVVSGRERGNNGKSHS